MIKMTMDSVPISLKIRCNPIKISQVISNLLNNSTDAISDRQDPWIKIVVQDTGDRVQIRITDCGLGIPPEVRIKLFVPFFTTKKNRRRHWIGLEHFPGIIKDHGGEITVVKDCPNTCLEVRLPSAYELIKKTS